MSAPTGYPISAGCVLSFVLAFILFLVGLFMLSECGLKNPAGDDAASVARSGPPSVKQDNLKSEEATNERFQPYEGDPWHPANELKASLQLPPHLLKIFEEGLKQRNATPERCPY